VFEVDRQYYYMTFKCDNHKLNVTVLLCDCAPKVVQYTEGSVSFGTDSHLNHCIGPARAVCLFCNGTLDQVQIANI
jgi:hypothetical protein